MAIKQGRYITADTTGKKEMAIRTTELDKVKDDPFVRRSEVQQTVNNSTLPVSSRAVNLFLSSYASITYVDDKFNLIDLSKYLTIENANQTYSTKAELAGKWDVQETVGNTSGKVMREGAYGIGSAILDGASLSNMRRGIYFDTGEFKIPPLQRNIVIGGEAGTAGGYLYLGRKGELYVVGRQDNEWGEPREVYSDYNTAIDSNGFLKAASPIIKLFDDRIETNGQFKEEPIFEKLGTGTYKISNTLGLAREGWTYEKPRGKDGNPYFHIKVDKLEDGCIISVHDVFEALEEATITDIDGNERKINKVVKILGEARDIKPHERWIDLRFHEEPEEFEEIEDGGV